MSEANKGLDPVKLFRDTRDAAMEGWARLTLRLTSSHEYQRLQGAISKPALLAVALYRKAADSAMSEVLANLNMPSREEVLQLSKRLTHIEMALDDLSAGLDQLRRTAPRPQRGGSREREGNGESRATPAKEA
jgi:hypothetical protein